MSGGVGLVCSHMVKLVVRDFSCIQQADIDVGKLTILIGPQASGKSVISKLIYFCYRVLAVQYSYIEENHNLDHFKGKIAEDFEKWFPRDAWGRKEFSINFSAGPF